MKQNKMFPKDDAILKLKEKTYINVKITKSNCTISNETCIKCIKIAHGFYVGNESGHAKHEY